MKIAIFFPGIGYTADKPLLYYSRRIAVECGYEVRVMNYSGFPSKVKGDRKRMEESFEIALEQSGKMLSGTDFSLYEDVLFVGKSIGTAVAAKIASENALNASGNAAGIMTGSAPGTMSENAAGIMTGSAPGTISENAGEAAEVSAEGHIRLILYTPLEDTFAYPFEKAIAFTGTTDPWVGGEKSRIPDLCDERGIPCFRIYGGNHSLESGEALADIRGLCKVMEETRRFIRFYR